MLRRARALWRTSRDSAVLRPLIVAADRAWWARAIRRADVVDVDFVAAQGRRLSARSAVRAYVRGGFARGLSLNPLFMERLVSSQLSDAHRVPALYAYAVGEVAGVRTSVAWDSVAYARAHPESVDAPGGPLGDAWRKGRSTGRFALAAQDGDATSAARPFSDVRAHAITAAQNARRAGSPALGALHSDLVLVCRLSADEDVSRPLDEAVAFARATDGDVVVAVAGRGPDAWVASTLLALDGLRVQVVRDDPDLLVRVQERANDRAVLVVRGPRAEIDAAALKRLADAGRAGPVAPVWVALDGTVASAGVGARDGRAFHLMAGHPLEDVTALGRTLEVHEVAGHTFARPATTVDAPPRTLLDLIVRAPADPAPLGRTTAPDTDLDSVLAPLRVETAAWTPTGPLLRRTRSDVTLDDGAVVPSLRWALKIVAPPGRPGEAWGDTHFARGLADALRRLGQEVVIDAYDARSRPSGYLDDVVLALRGPEPFAPQHGAFSMLWIISHPDQITAAEISGFDVVYAGSTSWAEAASSRFGRPVLPLLQCTDARRFHPTGAPRTRDIVFVGTARGIPRPSILEPIAAGVPVAVHGPDWRGWIPASSIASTGIPNEALARVYETAAVVLNDHWPAMKQAGFVSNRLYDVVAAGGRAVSDDVEGIADTFGGAVFTYRTVPELVDLLRGDLDSAFPDADELRELSARVRLEHSFDARARTLLDAAIRRR